MGNFPNTLTPHKNPIPAASRVCPFVATGVIFSQNPQTKETPPSIEAQCAQVFANMRAIMQEAGGSADDIIKLNVFLRDKTQRPIVNAEWVAMFPDHESRPARHVFTSDDLAEGRLIEAEFFPRPLPLGPLRPKMLTNR